MPFFNSCKTVEPTNIFHYCNECNKQQSCCKYDLGKINLVICDICELNMYTNINEPLPEEKEKLKRTKSSFVVINAGFFRDKQTNDLYTVKQGFYPIEECVTEINNGQKKLMLPESAVALIPRLPNTSVLKY